MLDQFINNRVTVNYHMSDDMRMRYSTEEVFEIAKEKVGQEFGKYVISKSKRVISENPTTLSVNFAHSCYIFSEEELVALANHIKMLEDENRWLRFEQNRRQAGHFDNI